MFKIKAKGKKAEVFIYEEIGDGFFGGITAKSFIDELKKAGAVDEINVRINSIGGSVFEGLAIYNSLNSHAATVTVDIDGAALSIASIIAMAGDSINMAENAMFMIHDPWGFAGGSAEELRDYADMLDKVRDSLLNIYTARTGNASDDVSSMMSDETWMSAAEARDLGFVDNVTENLAAAATPRDWSRFHYKNAPQPAAAAPTPRLDKYRSRLMELTDGEK